MKVLKNQENLKLANQEKTDTTQINIRIIRGRLLQTLQTLEKWQENTKNTLADKFNN